MAKEILKDEMMSDAELDNVAGGGLTDTLWIKGSWKSRISRNSKSKT